MQNASSTDVRLLVIAVVILQQEAALDPPGGDGTLRFASPVFTRRRFTFHRQPELNTESLWATMHSAHPNRQQDVECGVAWSIPVA